MSSNKQPKPFLKKGSRQFLSNATVRSLNQVPKIVQFGQPSDTDLQQTKSQNTVTFGKKNEEELNIQIKKSNSTRSTQQRSTPIVQQKKPKENKPMNQQKLINQQKPASSASSGGKKKPALLQDYLGAPSASKKDTSKNGFSRQKNKPMINTTSNISSLVGSLQKQQVQLQSDQDQKEQQVITSTKNSQYTPSANKNNFPPIKATVPKKSATVLQKEEVEQTQKICFKQESDEDEKPIKSFHNQKTSKMPVVNKFKPSYKVESNNKWQEEEEQQKVEPEQQGNRGPSKVLQKYYKKQPLNKPQKTNSVVTQPKLQIEDIPPELKDMIFNERLNDKKSDIDKKIQQLDLCTTKAKKQKQKYEEDNKRLMKERQQFQKQMQQKTKQFQQKIKNQNSKLNRQKKYMKDQQVAGTADWRLKNQVQQLRTKLQKSQAQKKKLKSDFQRQSDRLKKKIQQTTEQNQSLKKQIKYIQMQKIQIKQKSKQIQRKIQQAKKINYWQGAPTNSYLFTFADNDFTLLNYQPQSYHFENLQHYQYYLSKKDQPCQLQGEQIESNGKLVRRYKNGKEQIEYVGKVLRQNFPPPFKFNVVTHLNGDLKLIYPNGFQVYFHNRQQITEFIIGQQKTIFNFHQNGQIQMKFRHPHLGNINQILKDGILRRNTSRQGEEKFKKGQNDMVERLA